MKDATQFHIRPARPEEAGLFYTPHPEEDKRLGTVGHVRMDFGRSGNEFWHTWWPRGPEELNSPVFKAELQEVVDTLRESVLKSRRRRKKPRAVRIRRCAATPHPPPTGAPVSLRVGRFAGLTGHRPVIQYREPPRGKAYEGVSSYTASPARGRLLGVRPSDQWRRRGCARAWPVWRPRHPAGG